MKITKEQIGFDKDRFRKLRQLIKEQIKQEMPVFGTNNIKDLRNKPTDGDLESYIRLILMRQINNNPRFFRLQTDNWFRVYEGLGKGYGLMIRDIKINPTPVKLSPHWAIGKMNVNLRALIKYLPWEFDDIDDDIEQNYEIAKGLIILGNQYLSGHQILEEISIKQIENYIKSHIREYKP